MGLLRQGTGRAPIHGERMNPASRSSIQRAGRVLCQAGESLGPHQRIVLAEYLDGGHGLAWRERNSRSNPVRQTAFVRFMAVWVRHYLESNDWQWRNNCAVARSVNSLSSRGGRRGQGRGGAPLPTRFMRPCRGARNPGGLIQRVRPRRAVCV